MRLDKYIVNCTEASRKDVKKLVKNGLVSVNGITATRPEMQVREQADAVVVCGERIVYREFVYLMLNKPAGYVSATEDRDYPVVTSLVPEEYHIFSVFPVGRLDMDTEGLLILSNDGRFAHDITSPKKNIYKKYFAVLDKVCDQQDIAAFAAGMEFKDFTAKSAKLEITEVPNEVYISIAEGKYHQVKRMCERIGKTVVYLKRVSIGGLELDCALEPGEIRELTEQELDLLFQKEK